MLKRTLSVLLVLMLIVGCFVGCGDKKGQTDKKGDGQAAVDLPKLEITSDTVKYLCWEAQETLDDKTTASGFINDLMKQHYGCGLQVIKTTYEDLTQKAVQLILSGDSPDVVFLQDGRLPELHT